MKKCPFCAESIQEEATKCRFCGEWLDKKRILNKVIGSVQTDIKKADYSHTELIAGVTHPTAGKSITGWVFIVFGAAIGVMVYMLLLFAIFGSEFTPSAIFTYLSVPFVCTGGWMGKGLHAVMKNKLG